MSPNLKSYLNYKSYTIHKIGIKEKYIVHAHMQHIHTHRVTIHTMTTHHLQLMKLDLQPALTDQSGTENSYIFVHELVFQVSTITRYFFSSDLSPPSFSSQR